VFTLLTVVVIGVAGFSAVAGAYTGGSGATSLDKSLEFMTRPSTANDQEKPVTVAELEHELRALAAKETRSNKTLERKLSEKGTKHVTITNAGEASATV
jgi:hypothetical protein